MELFEIFLLAVASAFWPVLIAVDLVALRTPRPVMLLTWFLAGGLLTTITEGLIIVFVLDGTSLASGSDRNPAGWINVAGGVLALALAAIVRAGGRQPKPRPEKQEPGRWTGRVARGRGYAFGAGVVLNLLPGIFPLIALRNIAALDSGDGAKAALVVALYLIMFTLVEAPLLGLVLAPERAERAVRQFNGWLDRNGRRLGADVLALIGVFLIVRGIVQLAT